MSTDSAESIPDSEQEVIGKLMMNGTLGEFRAQFHFGKRISLFLWPTVALASLWVALILLSGISSMACSGMHTEWCDSWSFPNQAGISVGSYVIFASFSMHLIIRVIDCIAFTRWQDIFLNAWQDRKHFFFLALVIVASILIWSVLYLVINFPEKELNEIFVFVRSYIQ